MTDYDLIVIGAGPAGYVGAIRGAQLGLKTAIVEKDSPGGVCLNVGCIPTKALLKNAEVVHTVTAQAKEFGISFENLSIDYSAAFNRSRQVSGRLVKGVELLFKKNKIDFCRGTARLTGDGNVEVETDGGETKTLEGKNILIAAGARPRTLPGLVVDGKRIITYLDAIMSPDLPESAVIIGGGPIGMEFAYIWNAYGVEVTIVEMEDRLLPTEDPEVSKVIERAYKKLGITFFTSAAFQSAEVGDETVTVAIETKKGGKTLQAQQVMAAVGFRPNTENLGLKEAGVELTEKGGFIRVDEQMMTTGEGIYAAGDITGKLMLAHAGSAMGIAAAEAAAGKLPDPINYRMIPRCVYFRPQSASFGWSEAEAEAAGKEIAVGKFPFLANGKALGLNEREGFVKIVAEKESKKIIGAALVGAEVTELLPELTLAQTNGLTLEAVAKNIHAHPTVSEAIQEAAHAARGQAIHI